ncbi:hypothetical protein JKF63_07043 [Porcisia hertigi]|uniref:HIT-type domain-containing protein n=1 Tax=Porcisia hertigi TaxID=2761500 RepID=A0A836I2G6_9TRYP|nr:hypothetical protein JKF63_07043 [Porcisia hertigi]
MSRTGGNGRSAEQLERLARLSDDNAFVDVGAILKRMGGEDAWEEGTVDGSGGALYGSAFSMTGLPSSSGGPSTCGPTAAVPGARRGQVRKGARASEVALLSGARIPLTASLQDQHKAYLESVHAAAKESEKLISSSSSSSSSDGDSAADLDDKDGRCINGRVGAQAVEKREVVSRAKRGGAQRRTTSMDAPPLASLPSLAPLSDLVTVTCVRRCPTDGTEGEWKRRRGEQRACLDVVDTEEALKKDPAVHSWRPEPCLSLAAKLTEELRLIQQWKRIILEYPPCVINSVLTPESCAPWKQAGSTSRKADAAAAAASPSEATCVDSSDGAEVLPYPLLQVYSLCPSYEALTAGPVRRRCIVRCPTTEEGRVYNGRPRRGLVPASATNTEIYTQTLQVAGVAFTIPVKALGNRKRRSRSNREDGVGAAGPVSGGQVDFLDSGLEAAVQGEGHHHLCSVCMLPASYRCLRCRTALFCSIDCHVLHDATRCLKFTV